MVRAAILRLEAKAEALKKYNEAATFLELARLRIEAERDVHIDQAKAMGSALSGAQIRMYGGGDSTMDTIRGLFTQGFGIGEVIDWQPVEHFWFKSAKGRDIVAPSLAAGLAGEIRKRAEPEGPVLSPREREVLKLIAGGSSIPAMAKEMFLAPSTVKTHVQRLYEKLGVSDRAAAVAEAMRRKLLE